FVPALRLTWPGRLALGGGLPVPAVMAQEIGRGAARLRQGSQRVAFLIQAAERLGDRRHQARAERRQRFGQRAGQQLLVGFLGKLRLPELDQQVDQHLVAVLTEPEQGLVHRPTVVGGRSYTSPCPSISSRSFSRVSGTRLEGNKCRSSPTRWGVTKNQWRAMPRPATAFSPHPTVRNSVVPSAARLPNSSQVYPRRSG